MAWKTRVPPSKCWTGSKTWLDQTNQNSAELTSVTKRRSIPGPDTRPSGQEGHRDIPDPYSNPRSCAFFLRYGLRKLPQNLQRFLNSLSPAHLVDDFFDFEQITGLQFVQFRGG